MRADLSEFGTMLVRNSEFLQPVAVSLTRDPEKAKDLFQETIYRALVNEDKYNQGTNVRAWLYTIMRNIFINNYRRSVKKNLITYRAPEFMPDMHSEQPGPESVLHVRQIMNFVQRLPAIFRTPFMLYFEGFRYHEIADIMREPLGTIKSRIHFARKMLKAEIKTR